MWENPSVAHYSNKWCLYQFHRQYLLKVQFLAGHLILVVQCSWPTGTVKVSNSNRRNAQNSNGLCTHCQVGHPGVVSGCDPEAVVFLLALAGVQLVLLLSRHQVSAALFCPHLHLVLSLNFYMLY